MAQPMTSGQERRATDLFRDALVKLNLSHGQGQVIATSGGSFQQELNLLIARFTNDHADYKVAREILGPDFISPQEISLTQRVKYSQKQIGLLTDNIPDYLNLVWLHKHNYMLIPGPAEPSSLIDIIEMNPDLFHPKLCKWCIQGDAKFASTDKVGPQWLAVYKHIFRDYSRSYLDNLRYQGSIDDYVPNTAETSWCVINYFRTRGTYLFIADYVRTSSEYTPPDNKTLRHVYLGYFGDSALSRGHRGLEVSAFWADGAADGFGWALAKKLRKNVTIL